MMPRSGVEYATDNITVYRFCRGNCVYCWAWRVPIFRTRISKGKYNPIREAERYLSYLERRTIVISFTADPYPLEEVPQKLTRRVLEVLSKAKQHRILILTKNPVTAVTRDLDLMLRHGNMWLGTTITTLSDNVAEVLEPGATLPSARLAALKFAHEKGVKTWISIEPIIPYVTYPEDIVRETAEYVDWYVLGSLNYWRLLRIPKICDPMPEDGMFTSRDLAMWYNKHVPETVKILESLGKDYFIKKELMRWLDGDQG
ncbi:hypothetical protein DRN86_03580 [Candidatus Geothermarchaeota archaeon]|nr:MAG: hypothetical protein DRN86_03580 [Candidatus Geothermarchaeota archaeon]